MAKRISLEEERALLADYRAGKRGADSRLLQQYKAFAGSWAWKTHRRYGVDLDDLLQEAYRGIFIAADRFDTTQPWKFTTYASYWVRATLDRFVIDNLSVVRVKKSGQGVNGVLRYMHSSGHGDMSMNMPIGGADSTLKLEDLVADPGESTADRLERETHLARLRDRLEDMLETRGLSGMEKYVIRRRWLCEPPQATLDDLAKEQGVTRERIRQVQTKAFRKLGLRDFSGLLEDLSTKAPIEDDDAA